MFTMINAQPRISESEEGRSSRSESHFLELAVAQYFHDEDEQDIEASASAENFKASPSLPKKKRPRLRSRSMWPKKQPACNLSKAGRYVSGPMPRGCFSCASRAREV